MKKWSLVALLLFVLLILPYGFFPTRVQNSTQIAGPIEQVFDQVTTANFPQSTTATHTSTPSASPHDAFESAGKDKSLAGSWVKRGLPCLMRDEKSPSCWEAQMRL